MSDRIASGAGPRVSVVIPYFNASAHLGEAFRHLRGQDHRNFETIVVDDGSEPGEAAAAQGLCRDHGAVYLVQRNGGPGVARNRGVEAASGDYVAFLDVDDVWYPAKLRRQVAAVADDPSLQLVLHDTLTREDDGGVRSTNRYSSSSLPDLFRKALRGDLNSFTSALFVQREWFRRIGGFEPRLRFREDHLLLARAFREARCLLIDDVLSERLLHSVSMSSHARFPDPAIHAERAELFFAEVARLYPEIRLAPYRAHALQRVVRHNIVLGRHRQAMLYILRSLKEKPADASALKLAFALGLSRFAPARFDHWHPGLASVRNRGR